MRLYFSPQYRDDTPTVVRHDDVLTINGDVIDLSAVPDGATLPLGAISNPWIADDVHRIDGVLHVTLLWPCGATTTATPQPTTLTANGPVALPRDPEEA